jgi:hypothetical protein
VELCGLVLQAAGDPQLRLQLTEDARGFDGQREDFEIGLQILDALPQSGFLLPGSVRMPVLKLEDGKDRNGNVVGSL